jgi:hypothetical protein
VLENQLRSSPRLPSSLPTLPSNKCLGRRVVISWCNGCQQKETVDLAYDIPHTSEPRYTITNLSDTWTSRSVRMGHTSTSRSRLPNAVKECGGGKCNHHVQMKINSQRISKVYRRYAVYWSPCCWEWCSLGWHITGRESKWDNFMQQRVPKVICWQEFLRSEF